MKCKFGWKQFDLFSYKLEDRAWQTSSFRELLKPGDAETAQLPIEWQVVRGNGSDNYRLDLKEIQERFIVGPV